MENNNLNEQKKNGKAMKELVIFLLIVIIGLGGYIAFDKVLKDKICGTTKTETKEVKSDDTKKTDDDKTVDTKDTKTAAKTADEMYEEYIDNLKENMSKDLTKNTTVHYYGEDLDLGKYYVELNHDNELYVHGAADTEFEVATDVVQAFLVQSGQAGNSLLYFIKSDGKLYSANPGEILYTKKANSKELSYKNIVNVMPGNFSDDESGYTGPIFIDVEGNIFR